MVIMQPERIEVPVIRAYSSEIYFVLESETTGHLLPFHPFTVFDVNDQEIASGKTDENGEARVKVPKEGDYYVTLDSDLTYSISGKVFMRDGQTPLVNSELEIKPWGTDAYTVQTGSDGELSLNDIPKGGLILSFQEREYAVFVKNNIVDGFFFIDYDDREEPTEEDEMDYDDSLDEFLIEEEEDIDEEEDVEEEPEFDSDNW